MDVDTIFRLANLTALAGWAVLVASPLAPKWADTISGLLIPLILSVGYMALVLVYWADADGGFSSLSDVMTLFTFREVALAGWIHFLAFDLFVGAWITRVARREHVSHLLVIPCLGLTFMFGPVGFLAFCALRVVPRSHRIQTNLVGDAS